MVAIIGGTLLFDIDLFIDAKPRVINTDYGEVFVLERKGTIFLPRHGEKRNIPPHRINHRANIFCLKLLGVELVVGVNSCGSLHPEITVNHFVVPDDYISLWDIPTFFDEEIVHITPKMDEDLRRKIILLLEEAREPYLDKGVYIQTRGPRLETPAEIRMLRNFGDIVGMTMASEATACCELGLRYASICSVDNLCHGIGDGPLTAEEISKNAKIKGERLRGILLDLLRGLR